MGNKKRLDELAVIMDAAFDNGDMSAHKIALEEWVALMRKEYGANVIDELIARYSEASQPSHG